MIGAVPFVPVASFEALPAAAAKAVGAATMTSVIGLSAFEVEECENWLEAGLISVVNDDGVSVLHFPVINGQSACSDNDSSAMPCEFD